ncbi:hypothetical protein BKH43_02920 [Helicobacter sp. 13S00401-1]|uniref:hypothetical protein n=1 Tax=Helicobacter sp. 13S00401-1 TaxID=1905758 RepID=UPI000BA5B2E6|nr:hypothetical protein [Helicobacter sp. 13S00401-1]PAF51175.1 hypothetical protein BKH43_02920 [Helicobacter sp. 13S00401-1]
MQNLIKIISMLTLALLTSLEADNFMSKNLPPNPNLKNEKEVYFVVSNIIPLSNNFLVDTPQGRLLHLSKGILSTLENYPSAKTQKIYDMDGKSTAVESSNQEIKLYRNTQRPSDLYARISPNTFLVSRLSGEFYVITPMPKSLKNCNLLLTRTFEGKRQQKHALLLDLDSLPDDIGPARLEVQCPR